jgi:glycolate oxidase FAD binding subunit
MSGPNPLPLTKTIAPADQAELAEALRAARAEKTPIYPIGGGTRLDYGVLPDRPGIGLSLEKLNRLVDYEPDDWTITVEAGMTLAQLAKTLIQHRQRLPLDAVLPDRAAVGGLAAINPCGPRRFAHGTVRDYILGFTAVDGQGKTFSGGGRVLKNAAGYNMGRMMAGSLGTLGVITQLTLMVRPLPEFSAFAACDLPDTAAAERLVADLLQSAIHHTAVELTLGPNRQESPVFVPMGAGQSIRLFVGFEGPADQVQWMLDALRAQWQAAGVAAPMTVTNAWAALLWDWLAHFPADVQISVRPNQLTSMIAGLVALDPDCTMQAHAGDGILQASFTSWSNEGPSPYSLSLLRGRLRPLVESAGGKMNVLRHPDGETLSCLDVWGPRGEGFAVMQSLKDRFDPAGILNPGRFIFPDSSNACPLRAPIGGWSGEGQG